MTKIIEKLNQYKTAITLVIFFIGGIWFIFNQYQKVLDKNEQILAELKTTTQMALKAVIWNEDIPLTERSSACDVYLAAGYNSMTKKECQVIIEKGANQGIFSYVEKEGGILNDVRY